MERLKPISKLAGIVALSVTAISLIAFVFPKNDGDTLDRLVNALQKWSDTTSQEKVYLHTDKPYYKLGDTLWFKAYTTIGSRHQLSAKSGALYVELINSADSVAQLLKLPMLNGMAKGNFYIRKNFLEGTPR